MSTTSAATAIQYTRRACASVASVGTARIRTSTMIETISSTTATTIPQRSQAIASPPWWPQPNQATLAAESTTAMLA